MDKILMENCIFNLKRNKVILPIQLKKYNTKDEYVNVNFILDTGAENTCISCYDLVSLLNYKINDIENIIYKGRKLHSTAIGGISGESVKAFCFCEPYMRILGTPTGFIAKDFELYAIAPEVYRENNETDLKSVIGMDILKYFNIEIIYPTYNIINGEYKVVENKEGKVYFTLKNKEDREILLESDKIRNAHLYNNNSYRRKKEIYMNDTYSDITPNSKGVNALKFGK